MPRNKQSQGCDTDDRAVVMVAALVVTVRAGLSEEVTYREGEELVMWRAGRGEF